jgi:hypothetical protein
MSNQLFVTKMTSGGIGAENDGLLRGCTELCILYLKEYFGAAMTEAETDRTLGWARTS